LNLFLFLDFFFWNGILIFVSEFLFLNLLWIYFFRMYNFQFWIFIFKMKGIFRNLKLCRVQIKKIVCKKNFPRCWFVWCWAYKPILIAHLIGPHAKRKLARVADLNLFHHTCTMCKFPYMKAWYCSSALPRFVSTQRLQRHFHRDIP